MKEQDSAEREYRGNATVDVLAAMNAKMPLPCYKPDGLSPGAKVLLEQFELGYLPFKPTAAQVAAAIKEEWNPTDWMRDTDPKIVWMRGVLWALNPNQPWSPDWD